MNFLASRCPGVIRSPVKPTISWVSSELALEEYYGVHTCAKGRISCTTGPFEALYPIVQQVCLRQRTPMDSTE